MNRILVTGGTGNVGRHVVDQLRASGARFRVMTRDPGAARLLAEIEVVRGDGVRRGHASAEYVVAGPESPTQGEQMQMTRRTFAARRRNLSKRGAVGAASAPVH
jgi:nucleoside-diphosphate-sugar epimerase